MTDAHPARAPAIRTVPHMDAVPRATAHRATGPRKTSGSARTATRNAPDEPRPDPQEHGGGPMLPAAGGPIHVPPSVSASRRRPPSRRRFSGIGHHLIVGPRGSRHALPTSASVAIFRGTDMARVRADRRGAGLRRARVTLAWHVLVCVGISVGCAHQEQQQAPVIRDLRIEGTHAVSPRQIKKKILSSKTGWWPFAHKEYFDPVTWEADLKRICPPLRLARLLPGPGRPRRRHP